ncbi:MAG: EAL domain-containing protein [Ruminococcaceae bacterium]|nr:EAL domain-containing protein [Oscillospiraceae bacterium]
MNNCRDKMLELMLDQEIYVYFYIDYEANQWHLEQNPHIPEFSMSENDNPIDAILKDDRLAEDDKERFGLFAEKLRSGTVINENDRFIKIQFRMKSQNGEAEWYEINIYPKYVDYSSRPIITGTIHKMNEREIKNRNILNHYSNDKNPAVFADLMAKRIREDTDRKYAVIQFDVIGFKFINDIYGEAIGNELLAYFNDVLEICCNESILFSRLSADVFMAILPYEELSDIYSFIRGLEAGMSGYKNIKYSFAFGVYLVTDRNIATRLMGDSAGMARAAIKGNALENIGFYNNDIKNSMKSKRSIEDKMRSALKNGEFVMYLQPKYNISDSSVTGAEALVRWIDPETGIIPPNEFIPVFEKNGFVIKIDEYIWECACKQIRKWLDGGLPAVPISVNVSRVHLKDSKFINTLDELIKKYNIPQELLEIEITETADNINANEMIQLAKDKGFKLLMDDFGSGYSSLNTLRSTPFDVIKIDRMFFSKSMESERGQKIISHTISMSKDIGLDLIAEGVETQEQADFLKVCGCDSAQGFLYSRPVPVDMFDNILRSNYKKA